MKNLVIVESPSKAKTIQKYLGKDFKVLASSGHICDLPEKSLGIDIENNFTPKYEIPNDRKKKEIIKKLKEAVKECDNVYIAADPDREGEAISWHLSKILNLGEDVKRIEFNEISRKAVNEALKKPRKINQDLVDAQQARRIIDRLVGYKVTPILNRKIKKGLSGGRVQSAALKMLVDREREIRDFKPEEYWNIHAILTQENKTKTFKCALNDFNGRKFKISTQERAENIYNMLINATLWEVDKVVRGKSKSKPNPPFTTSTLQQDGSNRLQLTAPEVMRVAQKLYEGVDLQGEGHTALVTYIRTDSVRISPDAQKDALEFISKNYGKEYVPKKPNSYSSKKNSKVQDAHEAIRPISLERTPESIKNMVGRNEYRLYKLIYDRFLASQMAMATYDTLNVHINADCGEDKKFGFKLTGKTVTFKGYTVVYENEKNDDEDNKKLPNLQEGEKLNMKEITKEQKFTKAPPRYTDASLVKAMEDNGVGRPSTYATVISTLAKRKYTEKEGKSIKVTTLGETVTKFMETNFENIVDSGFTADMENKLDEIESGLDWHKILHDFYPDFLNSLKKADASDKSLKVEPEVSDVVCEKCGAHMVIRTSKYGKFLACPNYPKCKNIKSIAEVCGKCPECGGDIVKKRTKKGKIFYGCSNYPECNFMSWELPAPHYCPKCGSVMRIVKKDGNTKYICTNKECNYIEKVEDKTNGDKISAQ